MIRDKQTDIANKRNEKIDYDKGGRTINIVIKLKRFARGIFLRAFAHEAQGI